MAHGSPPVLPTIQVIPRVPPSQNLLDLPHVVGGRTTNKYFYFLVPRLHETHLGEPLIRGFAEEAPGYFSTASALRSQHCACCMFSAGNSKPTHPHGHGHSTIKDLAGSILGDDKKDDGELWNNVEAQTAFLGPNLWDKTYETDLKYVDLDEFLSENGVSMDGLGSHGSLGPLASSHPLPKRERSPSPSDCMSPDTINPSSPADSNEELKPQPIIKKSRKQFVPDDLKDDKYWARRRKNNLAAKRSRDARRMKENQIALRAGYLEKENVGLRQELERLKKENLMLQNKLAKYEDV
ncbi:hypothetical protein MTP99_008041 [Tenebrio molitor]|nr:hypothetical protein MTP99_008041 [Tenebrio molitor]